MVDRNIALLKETVKNSDHIVFFSGAGLSSESGIPTYRGKGGLWSKYDPLIYADINYFLKDPSYYWHFFKDERYPMIKKSKPNQAHYFIAEIEKRGKVDLVITQNIDGLHQLAGQKKVVELHGTVRSFRCMSCEKIYSIEKVYQMLNKEFPPDCVCGGRLRPNTVMFGESLPPDALSLAVSASKSCDVFIVVGSSLLVSPASDLPLISKEQGAFLAIINIGSTPLDSYADVVFNNRASEILKELI